MDLRKNIQRGMSVRSSDGLHVGRVTEVREDSIIIEKGAFFLRDVRISSSGISAVQGEEVLLLKDYAALRLADSESFEDTAQSAPARLQGPEPRASYVPQPHEPPMSERRAAGPGWDPLSVDEEVEQASRTSEPDAKPPTRY